MENKEANKTPDWLVKVQQGSWEPEVLLSGFVLIGLLQLPKQIDAASDLLRNEFLFNGFLGIFVGLKQAVYWLIAGLVLHLVLRGIWVGFVGLSFTFPGGIRAGKLGFQPGFARHIAKIPDTETLVLRLEKACSSIFAACFYLIMCIVGAVLGALAMYFAMLVCVKGIDWAFGTSVSTNNDWGVFFDSYVIPSLFLLIAADLMFVGLFRRNKVLARIFYPLYVVAGWVTLSRIYRPIYYVFATNVKPIYLTLFFMFFIVTAFFFHGVLMQRVDRSLFSKITMYETVPGQNLFSPYYSDRNENWKSAKAFIPSPILKGRFLELGIKHSRLDELYAFKACGMDPDKLPDDPLQAGEAKLRCASMYYLVYLDEMPIADPGWMYYYHQQEKRKGFICFLDTEGLPPGKHRVRVMANMEEAQTFADIVFFKE